MKRGIMSAEVCQLESICNASGGEGLYIGHSPRFDDQQAVTVNYRCHHLDIIAMIIILMILTILSRCADDLHHVK